MARKNRYMNPQNNRPGRSQQTPQQIPQVSPTQFTPELIQAWIANQQDEIQNEARRLEIQRLQLEQDSVYANRVLDKQEAYLKQKPIEERKTITRFAYILGGFVILVMGFTVYCLNIKERDFIYQLLKGLGYLVSLALGYYFGQRNQKKPKSDSDSADVVDSSV